MSQNSEIMTIPPNKGSQNLTRFQKQFYTIAHRGASAYYPENTFSAFRAAVEMNADMIELDVLLSKDNIPVVFHDEKLDMKTNGSGYVREFTLKELKLLDAGSWFDPKFKDERISTLREILEYAKNKILVNIEIKTEAVTEKEEWGIVELVLSVIKELDMENEVIISSFDYRVFNRIIKSNSRSKLALLFEPSQSKGRDPLKLVSDYSVDAFNMGAEQLNDNWIQQLNKNNIPFFVYTVNDKEQMEYLIRAGATGIFTDKPDVLKVLSKEVLKKSGVNSNYFQS